MTAAQKAPAQPGSQPFQVRGSVHTVLTLKLIQPSEPDFMLLLAQKIAHAPEFYQEAPLVLDLAAMVDREPVDLVSFCRQLRELRLHPVGVQNATTSWKAAAAAAELAVFGAGGPTQRAARERAQAQAPEPPTQPMAAAPPPGARRGAGRIIAETVRGGQQVQCEDGDLTLLASVAHGAEVAAGGHIHIYGALRGRAFAGIHGDRDAMIFCELLAAELISIAGIYLVSEDIDPRMLNRRVRISCDGERLVMSPVP